MCKLWGVYMVRGEEPEVCVEAEEDQNAEGRRAGLCNVSAFK